MAYPYKLYGGATRPDAISGLNPEFDQALLALYQAAPPEVQAELALNSAYRSNIVQQSLWNQSDKTGHSVARPGTSKHEKGMAADLFGFGLTHGKQVSQATKDWVHQNAGKFGLNFPMQHEPWHIQMANADTTEAKAVVAQNMQQQGYSPDQIKQAFLASIASTESPGYDVMYGGKKFTDYSRHPGELMPILDQQGNVTGHSSAAGRYQFLKPTWEEQVKKYGYKDFSPETQDRAAWNYANEIYGKQTGGGSLEEALQSGDPARINAAAQVLNKTWTSLPGGPEAAKSYGNQTFADVYNKNLGGSAVATDSPSEKGGARFGGTGLGEPSPEKKKEPWWKSIGKGLAEGGGMTTASMPSGTGITDTPRAVLAPGQPTTYGQGTAEEADFRRQNLAMLMQKLNAGRLF